MAAFLRDELPFTEIPAAFERVLRRHRPVQNPTLDQILQADAWAHEQIKEVVG